MNKKDLRIAWRTHRIAELEAERDEERRQGEYWQRRIAELEAMVFGVDGQMLLARIAELEAERGEWRDMGDEYLVRAQKAEAERDALRRGELTETIAAIECERNAAEAERDRLRAALTAIAKWKPSAKTGAEIARAALAGEEKP